MLWVNLGMVVIIVVLIFLLDHLGYLMVTSIYSLSGLNPIKLVVIQFTDWTRLGDIPMETQVDQVIQALENDNHRWLQYLGLMILHNI